MSTITFSTNLEQSYYNSLRPNEQKEYKALSSSDRTRALNNFEKYNKGYRQSAKKGTLSPEALKELERSNKAAAALYAGIKPVTPEKPSETIAFKRIDSEDSIEPSNNFGVTSSTTDSEGAPEVAQDTKKQNLFSRIATVFSKREMDVQDNETTGYGFAMHRPDLLPK